MYSPCFDPLISWFVITCALIFLLKSFAAIYTISLSDKWVYNTIAKYYITCNAFLCKRIPRTLVQNDLSRYGSFLNCWSAVEVRASLHLLVIWCCKWCHTVFRILCCLIIHMIFHYTYMYVYVYNFIPGINHFLHLSPRGGW